LDGFGNGRTLKLKQLVLDENLVVVPTEYLISASLAVYAPFSSVPPSFSMIPILPTFSTHIS
jgi:hypothetical protein